MTNVMTDCSCSRGGNASTCECQDRYIAVRPVAKVVRIEKHWDGNECESEHNGRIYVSRGRWQWLVIVDDVTDSAYDLRRDAKRRADELAARGVSNVRLHGNPSARQ